MAEENVNSPVIPDKSESGASISSDNGCSIIGHDQGVSFSSGDDVNNSRRNSTGKPSPVKSKQKIVPHYLRASTGSCHDFCKYGRKQAFEEEKRYPVWKRTMRPPSDKQNFIVTTAQGERKKAMAFKHSTSAGKKSPSLEFRAAPVVVQSLDPPEIIKREVLTSKKFEISPKQDLSVEKKMLKTEKRIKIASEKHSVSVEPQPTKQFKKKMNTFSERLSPSTKPQLTKQSKKKTNSISEKLPPVQPRLIKQSSSSSSSYPRESGIKTRKAEKGMKILPEKTSPSPAPWRQPITANSSSSSRVPGDANRRGSRKDYVKTSKSVAVSKSPAKKIVVLSTSANSRRSSVSRTTALKAGKTGGSKQIPPPMSQNRTQMTEGEETNTEKVPEKTLHVVKTETKNDLSELTEDSNVIQALPSQSYPSPDSLSQPHSSPLSSHEEVEEVAEEDEEQEEEQEEEEDGDDDDDDEEEEEDGYSNDKAEEFISENNNNNNTGASDVKAMEGNHKKPLRKGTALSESKDPTAVKLSFRRGKVVDVRSESNGPRRLRFRRARVMEENHDSKNEIRRKFFKKKGNDGDGSAINPRDKKVVLRHQDAKEKKDAQGLFNNVIEETASKLVESRKSKVKALVGAFETVISLQESKPSSQPVV